MLRIEVERLVFSRWLPEEGEQVFIMRADGSDVRQLTFGLQGAESQHPAWSPDASRICFASRRNGYSSLYLINADGSPEECLTPGDSHDDEFPAWSPDGREVAFSRGNRRVPEDLWLIDVGSRKERALTTDGLMDYSPCWSPDGRLVAFRRSLGRSPGIYVLPAAGGEAWFVIEGRSPSWHPEGVRMAYSDDGRIGTVVVDDDGHPEQGPVWLTGGADTADDYPCWSPDGSRLAFEREIAAPNAGEAHVFTVRVDGDEVRDLGEGHRPAWSPSTSRDRPQALRACTTERPTPSSRRRVP